MPRGRDGERGGRIHLALMVGVLAAIGVLAAAGSGLEDGDDTSGAPAGRRGADEGTLAVAFGEAPRSLDPPFATDRTSANLVLALMEPLVRLGPNLEAQPALARSWEISPDGRRVTFELRPNARWTNGDPVTAEDVVFAWKRLLSPSLGSTLAGPLLGVRGATAFNACTESCGALAGQVGLEAPGPSELVVRLSRRDPSFVRSTGLPQLVPLHRSTVLREGRRWTRRAAIVTNGPFALEGLSDTGVALVRNRRFRALRLVRPERVEGRFIADARARVQAFDAGQVAALDGSPLPATDLPALRERREFEAYPTLDSHLYGFNFTTVSDVHQRRAMALAVDREELEANVTQGGELPAVRFTPAGAPRQGRVAPDSDWLPADGDLAAAREELDRAAVVNRAITLLHEDTRDSRDVAVYLRSTWRGLGIETTIRSQDPETYLEFEGPLTPRSADLYEVALAGAVPDAWPSLAVWTCRAEANKTNFCNGRYDRFLAAARRELDPVLRNDLLVQAEEVLAGSGAAMPAIPLVWPVFPNLESLQVRDAFAVNSLGQIDFSVVEPD